MFFTSHSITSVLRHCWLGDRKAIRYAKMFRWWHVGGGDWSFACLTAPDVTTTFIILSSSKVHSGAGLPKLSWKMAVRRVSSSLHHFIPGFKEVWYGIVEFNVHSTQCRSFRRRGPWAVMYISHSVMDGQQHNNRLNPRCLCLQRPKTDGSSS